MLMDAIIGLQAVPATREMTNDANNGDGGNKEELRAKSVLSSNGKVCLQGGWTAVKVA